MDAGEPGGEELDEIEAKGGVSEGAMLFNQETFGGNGRLCKTCHPSGDGESGTVSPADVQARFQADPNDPLFVHDGADTIGGNTFNRIREHATILVTIDLPKNVSIRGSKARSVTLRRGVPTTMNTPSFDSQFQYDGRFHSLQDQARGAIDGHAQSTNVSNAQLNDIAAFQGTLFNRGNLKQFIENGTPLSMPYGTTESEQRGRRFFIDDAETSMAMVGDGFTPCGWCHSGNFMNETSPFFEFVIEPGVPAGTRFITALVSELNDMGNPVYDFQFKNPDGTITVVTSPDPGLALITGDPNDTGFQGSGFMLPGSFKIPTVWGVKDTAPYFHDNSSKTLEDLMEHYDIALQLLSDGFIDLSEQDKADIAAYMRLL